MAADDQELAAPPIPDEKPKKSKKPKKKDSGATEDRNPINKAKEALNTISGLPSIDIDDLITNLLKNTEDSVMNNVDWKSIYQALASDDKNSDISENIKHISSLDFISSASHMERLNKYNDFIMILKRVPIIKKILRLYTANILAPDDISKISIKIVPKNPTINKGSEEYISIENKFKVILDKIDLEDKLYDLVFKTLFYGDMFIEILSSKRYLLQTIYNLQIPIKDDKIKITESALDDMYEEITTINMECGFNGSITPYQVNIEWQKPLQTQIQETMDFANTYYFSILNNMGITENNYDRYKNVGIVKYLNEIFFGNQHIFDKPNSFKIFHEDFTTFTNSVDDINNNAPNTNTNSIEDIEAMNKRYSLDYLPVQSTLSSLNIKIHSPNKIIILKDEEIEYGYLYISSGLDNLGDSSSNTNSVIGSGSVSSNAVISTSNFVNQSNVQNNLGMFGNGTSNVNGNNAGNNTAKLSHSKQISARIAQYIKTKFEEYHGDVNIDNMSPNLQMLIADVLNNGSNNITVRYIPPLNMQQFKIEGTGLNAPYGEAVTEDLLFRAKMLLADDINSIINKFTATGKRLVWTVNANTHQQAANRIQQASRAINKKTIAVDDCLDIMASAIFPQDNIFIAKVNGEPQIELSTVELGDAQSDKDNDNYLIKQLITGADVPPAHLGFY